jgi:hypothetical protein
MEFQGTGHYDLIYTTIKAGKTIWVFTPLTSKTVTEISDGHAENLGKLC